MERKLNLKNINTIEQEYLSSIEGIGSNIRKLEGIDLLTNIKRAKVGTGPYPDVSLFEAANRIMSDLVILRAINYLLYSNILPFDEYLVEFGNEDNNQHDITSCKNDKRFAGEAFNVAPSFYQGKKRSSKNRLSRSKYNADYKFIIANADAVTSNYQPLIDDEFHYLFVDIYSDLVKLFMTDHCQVSQTIIG